MTRGQARALPLESSITLRDGRTAEVIGFYTHSDAVVVKIRHGEIVVLTGDRLTVADGCEVREC